MTGGEDITVLVQFYLHIWRRKKKRGTSEDVETMEKASCSLPTVHHRGVEQIHLATALQYIVRKVKLTVIYLLFNSTKRGLKLANSHIAFNSFQIN